MENITKEDFKDFIEVRDSGRVNMFDINGVSSLSGLDKDTIKTILAYFDELLEKYNKQ